MKIVIHPKYERLRAFITAIPKGEHTPDLVFRDYRNILTKVTVEDTPLVVKQYKRPTWLNCFVYSFLRMSKAKRSYVYASILQHKGVQTADPVAYIEIRRCGLFHTGYFISEFLPHRLLDETVLNESPEVADEILRQFAAFTVDLHRQGIIHRDYNPSNILLYEVDGKYQFAVIDINRMRFRRRLSRWKKIEGLKSLHLPHELLVCFLRHYSELEGWDPVAMHKDLNKVRSRRFFHRFKEYLRNVARSRQEKREQDAKVI